VKGVQKGVLIAERSMVSHILRVKAERTAGKNVIIDIDFTAADHAPSQITLHQSPSSPKIVIA
jgi:hypothetical protein